MSSKIMQFITPAQRAEAMRFGAYTKLAELQVPFKDIDGLVKKAVELPSASGVAKSVITLSVLTGVPLGIAAHVIGSKIDRARGKVNELRTETGYYRNATNQLHRGLDAATAAS